MIIFSALDYFRPIINEGNAWPAIVGASIALWLIHALILIGVREAAIVNLITTIAKLGLILIFAAAVLVASNLDTFRLDLFRAGTPGLGRVFDHVRSTMLVTFWVFIGIEGASMISARVERRQRVDRATIFGFPIALSAYMLISILFVGITTQPELARLKNPSMVGVLEQVAGPWGAAPISLGLNHLGGRPLSQLGSVHR